MNEPFGIRRAGAVALGLACGALLSGCASSYQVIRIPDDDRGLAGYQRCSRSVAPISFNWYKMWSCLTDIPGFWTTGRVMDKSQYVKPSNCRVLTTFDARQGGGAAGADNFVSVQACQPGSKYWP